MDGAQPGTPVVDVVAAVSSTSNLSPLRKTTLRPGRAPGYSPVIGRTLTARAGWWLRPGDGLPCLAAEASAGVQARASNTTHTSTARATGVRRILNGMRG